MKEKGLRISREEDQDKEDSFYRSVQSGDVDGCSAARMATVKFKTSFRSI